MKGDWIYMWIGELLMALLLIIMGILFIRSNGKGCDFLAGYNMATSEERKDYDEVKLCTYTGKTFIVWGGYFIIGALIDYFVPGVGIILAIILFIASLLYYSIYIRWLKFDKLFKIKK